MIIVNGRVAQIDITPASTEPDGEPKMDTATVKIELEMPNGAGLCNLIVPNAAMGGIVVGPARIMVESA
jgi:hypothetical protein